jgi:hypothetical protein
MSVLPKEIRQQVNRTSHRLGTKYGIDLRDSLLSELLEIQELNGSTISELNEELAKLISKPSRRKN